MRYTDQIRRYTSLTAAAVLTACMLFGCTRADVASTSQNANVSNGNSSVGQSTVNGSAENSLAGAGSAGGQTVSSSQPQPATQAASGDASGSGQSAAPVTGQTAQNVSGTTTASTPSSAETAASQQPEVVQTPDEGSVSYDGGTAYVEESFTGVYIKRDGEETVEIAFSNDNQITFLFESSGISGSAQIDGNRATYYGDDGYSITFDIAGDVLGIAVGGEGGEQSSMNGVYDRVVNAEDAYVADDQDDYDVDDAAYADAQ